VLLPTSATLEMEAAVSCGKLVSSYQTKSLDKREDSNLSFLTSKEYILVRS